MVFSTNLESNSTYYFFPTVAGRCPVFSSIKRWLNDLELLEGGRRGWKEKAAEPREIVRLVGGQSSRPLQVETQTWAPAGVMGTFRRFHMVPLACFRKKKKKYRSLAVPDTCFSGYIFLAGSQSSWYKNPSRRYEVLQSAVL